MNYGEITQTQQGRENSARNQAQRYMANVTAREAVMDRIANGVRITRLADDLGLPYTALYAVLTSTYKDQYRAARAAYAELLAEKNLDMADKVERLEMPHDAARTAAGIRQWHMERSASENWGQKSTVDMNLKGIAGLHLEAIRQLSSEPIEGEFTEVSDDDRVESADPVGGGDDPGGGGDDGHGPDPAAPQPGRLKGEELL
jgi:hypothetical protein